MAAVAAHLQRVLPNASQPRQKPQLAGALAARPRVCLPASRRAAAAARRPMTVTAMAASEPLFGLACVVQGRSGGSRQWQGLGAQPGAPAGMFPSCLSHAAAAARRQPPRACSRSRSCPPAELIDGKAIAEDIRKELKAEVEELKAKYGGKVRRRHCRRRMGGADADAAAGRPRLAAV